MEIMLQQLTGYQKPDLYRKRAGGVWDVYIRIQGVRGLSQALASLPHIKVIEPLHRQPYGQTEVVIEDLNGYTLVFAERV